MEGNPYSAIISKIREDFQGQVPASYRLGEVISDSPLTVNVAGIQHSSDSLLKSSTLTTFSAGERLLLQPIENEQRYIIICKVVSI